MANNRSKYYIDLKINGKSAYKQVQSVVDQIRKLTSGSLSGGKMLNLTPEIQQANRDLAQLEVQLSKALNPDTGKLDLSKFNEQLKQGGTSIEQYAKSFSQFGEAGKQAFNQFGNAILQAEIPLRRSSALVDKLWGSLKNVATWQVSTSIFTAITGQISAAFNYAQDLNNALNDIRIVSGANAEEMAKFAKQANESAKALSTTTKTYAQGALIYYQQGLSESEVKKRTDITIKMANVTKDSADEVSSYMTAIWNNFDDGSKSLEYYSDVIVKLGAATAASSAEIAAGLEKFAAIGDVIGLSYEYATAALTTVVAATRQSEDVVGTAFKTIFARIQGLQQGETQEDGVTLNKYSEALYKVGIDILDVNGELKEMDVILDELGAKWGTLEDAEKAALAQTVGGTRQYNQLISLMENWETFKANVNLAETSEGELDAQADIFAESWEAASNRVRAAAEDIYSSLINDEFWIDLMDFGTKALEIVDKVIDGLGGLKGVLLSLGGIIGSVLAPKIAGGLRNTAFNIASLVNPEKMALKQNQTKLDTLAAQQQGLSKNDPTYKMQNAIIEKEKALITQSRLLTDEQIEQEQVNLRNLRTQVEQTKELEKQLQLKRQEAELDRQGYEDDFNAMRRRSQKAYFKDASSEVSQTIGQGARDIYAARTLGSSPLDLESRDIQKTKYASALSTLTGQELDVSDAATFDIQKLKQLEDSINNELYEYLTELQTAITSENWEPSLNLTAQLDNLENIVTSKVQENINNSVNQAQMDINGKPVDRKTLVRASGLGEDSFLGQELGLIESEQKVKKATKAQQDHAKAVNDNVNQINEETEQLKGLNKVQTDTATKMTGVATSLMQLGAIMSSINQVISVFKDESADGADKAKAIGTAALLIIPMIMSMSASLISAGVAVQTAFLPLSLILLGIVAVITLVTIGVKALSDAYNADAIAAEKAAEAATKAKEAYEEANAAYKDLKSSIEDYQTAYDALSKLVEGSEQWKDAVYDLNQQVFELVDTYPELLKYLNYDYSQGVYTLEEAGLQSALKKRQSAAIQSQATSQRLDTVAEQASLQARQQELARDLSKVDGWEIAGNIAQIVGGLGLSAASVAATIGSFGLAAPAGATGVVTGLTNAGAGALGLYTESQTYDDEAYNELEKIEQAIKDETYEIEDGQILLNETVSEWGTENFDEINSYIEDVISLQTQQLAETKLLVQAANADNQDYAELTAQEKQIADVFLGIRANDESQIEAAVAKMTDTDTEEALRNYAQTAYGYTDIKEVKADKGIIKTASGDKLELSKEQIESIKKDYAISQLSEYSVEDAQYVTQGLKLANLIKSQVSGLSDEDAVNIAANILAGTPVDLTKYMSKTSAGTLKGLDVTQYSSGFSTMAQQAWNQSLTSNYDTQIAEAFKTAEEDRYTKIASVLQDTANYAELSNDALQTLKETLYGSSENVSEYEKQLQNLAVALNTRVAIGLGKVSQLLADNEEALGATGTREYLTVLDELATEMENLFGEGSANAIDTNWIQTNLENILLAAENDIEALDRLQVAYSKAFLNTLSTISETGKSDAQSLFADLAILNLVYGQSVNQEIISGFQTLVENGEITVTSLQMLLHSFGYDLQVADGQIKSIISTGDAWTDLFANWQTMAQAESEKTQKLLHEEIERYHQIEKALEDITTQLDKLSKAKDHAFGGDRIALVEKEADALRTQIELQERYLADIKAYAESDRSALLGVGAQIDENGIVTNYQELMTGWVNAYNAGGLSDEQYEYNVELLNQYEETMSLLSEKEGELTDLLYQLHSLRLEKISAEVEYNVEISEDGFKEVDFLLKGLDDKAYDAAESIAQLGAKMEITYGNWQTYYNGLEATLKETLSGEDFERFMSGDNAVLVGSGYTAEQIKQLTDYRDQLIASYEDMVAIREEVETRLTEAFTEWNKKVDESINKFETYNSILTNFQKIVRLISQSDLPLMQEVLTKLNEQIVENSAAQLEAITAQRSGTEQDLEDAKKQLQAAKDRNDTESVKYWEGQVKTYTDTLLTQTKNWQSTLISAIEAVGQTYKTSIEDAGKALESGFSDVYTSFEEFFAAKDQSNKIYEVMLKESEELYEMNKLNREVQEAINKTSDPKAKKELLETQTRITQKINDGQMMTKAELEYEQKRLEVQKAQIALDEIQKAKNSVRLTRDAEGNYGYMYTADTEAIAEAQQTLEDAQYDMANSFEEAYNSLMAYRIKMEQDFQADIAKLDPNDTNYNEKLQERQAQYDRDLKIYESGLSSLTSTVQAENDAQTVSDNEYFKFLTEGYTGFADWFANDYYSAFGTSVDNFNITMKDKHDTYLSGVQTSLSTFQTNTQLIWQAAGVDVDNWADTIKDATQWIAENSDGTAEDIKGMLDIMDAELDECTKKVTAFQTEWQKIADKTNPDSAYNKTKGMIDQVNTLKSGLDGVSLSIDNLDGKSYTITENREIKINTNSIIDSDTRELMNLLKRVKTQEIEDDDNKDEDPPPNVTVAPSVQHREWIKTREGEEIAINTAFPVNSDAQSKKKILAQAFVKTLVNRYLDDHPSGLGKYFNIPEGEDERISDYLQEFYNLQHGYTNLYSGLYSGNIYETEANTLLDTLLRLVSDNPFLSFADYVSNFDTGGYTGAWGPEGKWAMLHEKELVLNAHDTDNMLTMLDIVRQAINVIDSRATTSLPQMASLYRNNISGGQTIAQTVEIHAEFPNATDHYEIEEAFNNLINESAQYADRIKKN